jgi:hypothetical protein
MEDESNIEARLAAHSTSTLSDALDELGILGALSGIAAQRRGVRGNVVCVPQARVGEVLEFAAKVERQELLLQQKVRDDAVQSWDQV